MPVRTGRSPRARRSAAAAALARRGALLGGGEASGALLLLLRGHLAHDEAAVGDGAVHLLLLDRLLGGGDVLLRGTRGLGCRVGGHAVASSRSRRRTRAPKGAGGRIFSRGSSR